MAAVYDNPERARRAFHLAARLDGREAAVRALRARPDDHGARDWAKIERDDGCPLLVRNPWEGFPIPREDTPTRPELDRARKTRVRPLSTRARAAILRALERRRAEGLDASPWLLPAQRDTSQPVSKSALHNLMKRTRKRPGIDLPRLGYHGREAGRDS